MYYVHYTARASLFVNTVELKKNLPNLKKKSDTSNNTIIFYNPILSPESV